MKPSAQGHRGSLMGQADSQNPAREPKPWAGMEFSSQAQLGAQSWGQLPLPSTEHVLDVPLRETGDKSTSGGRKGWP
jgi:hypothetical protein